jgi:hypothetical protein
MHSSFNNYQIITLVCALLTITACLLAAASGLRVNALIEESEKKAATALTGPDPAVAQELERTQQFLKGIQEQLKAERERSEKLKERVVELERSKAGLKIELPASSPTPLPESVKVGNTRPPAAKRAQPQQALPKKPVAAMPTAEKDTSRQPLTPLFVQDTTLPTLPSAPEKEDLTPVTSSPSATAEKLVIPVSETPEAGSQPPVDGPAHNATAPIVPVPTVSPDEN